RPEDRPRAHPAPGAGPRAAAEGHARLHDRLQADPDLRRLPPRDLAAQRRRHHERHRGDPPERDRHRRRRRAPGRHDRDGDRLRGHAAADRRADPRPRRPGARGGLARGRDAGLQGHDGQRLPEPVLPRRAEHRPRPQLDRLRHRGAAAVRDGGAADDALARPAPGRAARRGAGRLQPQDPGVARGHRVERGRLRVLVPRRRRSQHDAVADLHVPDEADARDLRRPGVRDAARLAGRRGGLRVRGGAGV
ncbi:MAG: Cyclohexanone monooxygenase, partial [uncultured Solirubrobacteraceae bacterium]